ncbi:hypothetical protein NKH18_03040 [Streptomyces sp. M10(2022)]
MALSRLEAQHDEIAALRRQLDATRRRRSAHLIAGGRNRRRMRRIGRRRSAIAWS